MAETDQTEVTSEITSGLCERVAVGEHVRLVAGAACSQLVQKTSAPPYYSSLLLNIPWYARDFCASNICLIGKSQSSTIKQRNAQFNAKARAGKNPVNPSRQEKAAKQSPIGKWALAAVIFVVLGGGMCYITTLFQSVTLKGCSGIFELLRLFFL